MLRKSLVVITKPVLLDDFLCPEPPYQKPSLHRRTPVVFPSPQKIPLTMFDPIVAPAPKIAEQS